MCLETVIGKCYNGYSFANVLWYVPQMGGYNLKNDIFLENAPEFTFEDYMSFNKESRGNMGDMLPVQLYRLLEYSLREELLERWGKNEQIAIFRKAGYRAGAFFIWI